MGQFLKDNKPTDWQTGGMVLLESASVMSSIPALADALYAEEVARARAMRPGQKLLEGPRLFDRACRLMLSGIRHQHPELDQQGARALLATRLLRVRALEDR